ncbi:DUF2537 domain-containing protein [Nakamurella antarctica]|nr:DUF2537 domain-containing protein [Nakamurella antarctica]
MPENEVTPRGPNETSSVDCALPTPTLPATADGVIAGEADRFFLPGDLEPGPAVAENRQPAADWEWVEQWRAGGERTPWGPGLVLAAFAAAIVAIAIYVITAGLSDQVIFAIIANVVIAGGLSPALWVARTLPVLRWISLGGACGAVVAWCAVLFFPIAT